MAVIKVLLIVLGVVFALILLLLLIKYTVVAAYSSDFYVYLKIGFVKINIKRFVFGKKKKKAKIIKFDGNFDLLDGKIENKEKNKAKHKFKTEKKTQIPAKTEGEPQKKQSVKEVVQTYVDLFSETFAVFAKYAKIKITKLKIVISSPEPDKTALMFGNANTALGTFIYVCRKYRFLEIKGENVGVYTDFTKDKPEASGEVLLCVRGYQALICAMEAFKAYNKMKNKGGDKYGKTVNERNHKANVETSK